MGERIKQCKDCIYCCPVLTPKGTYHSCMNPDSEMLFADVSNVIGCPEWAEETEAGENEFI